MLSKMSRICIDCEVEKEESSCFELMPTGKYRKQCKECVKARRKSAKTSDAATKLRDERQRNTPQPASCVECGRAPPVAVFKWRNDSVSGGWRTLCNKCYVAKDYHGASRRRQ